MNLRWYYVIIEICKFSINSGFLLGAIIPPYSTACVVDSGVWAFHPLDIPGIRALSEQICEPGYRAVRSPLLVWVRSYTAPQLEILEL